MSTIKVYNPAALLKEEITGICLNTFDITGISNAGEWLVFDATGGIELQTAAAPIVGFNGTWQQQTAAVTHRMPLQTPFVIDHMKIVHYSGNELNDTNMIVRLYRLHPDGQLNREIMSMQEGNDPANPNRYILDFYDLKWLVDPWFGISFECSLELTFAVSFDISLIETQLELTAL